MTNVMSAPGYVHGYSPDEAQRLGDQADTLAGLLHSGTSYPAGSRVLEVGCGVGAQTVHLVAGSPAARFTAIDTSAASLARARRPGPRSPTAAVSGGTCCQPGPFGIILSGLTPKAGNASRSAWPP